jgi:hypothetical protein
MNKFTHLPFTYEQGPGYYFTYYGEIYHGTTFWAENRELPFYIVPNFHIREVNEMDHKSRTHEKLKTLGIPITNPEIIIYHQPVGIRDSYKIGIEEPHESLQFGNKLCKKMFVFGAGASAYCTFGEGIDKLRSSKLRPPAGFEIFNSIYDDILDGYKGANSIVPLFESRGNDIEACLEQEWQDIANAYNPSITATHINIQYFLRDLFCKISEHVIQKHHRYNLYALFARKLQTYLSSNTNEHVGIVSFNYDTILDHYLEDRFRIQFNTLSDYTDSQETGFSLFKPHGSCNWGWSFDGKFRFKNEDINHANISQYLYDNKITPAGVYYNLLGGNEMINRSSYGVEMHGKEIGRYGPNKNRIKVAAADEMVFPALLMPYRDKDEFILRYNQQILLELWIDKIEELILIGWKGNEYLFNEKLKNKASHLKKVTIVNPEPDVVRQNLAPFIDINQIEVVCIDTFEEFVIGDF